MELRNTSIEPDCWKALPSWGPEPAAPAGRTWGGLMRHALRLARAGARAGEIPVGALVIGPEAHVEVLALRRAAARVGNHRLGGCILVVTLEPCLMCTGAIRESRVSGVVFGASDARAGAVCSCLEGLDYAQTGAQPWSYGGVEAEACAEILRQFFRVRR